MPKYDVHVYAIIRVKIAAVEANDPIEAAKRADERVDLHRFQDVHIDGASEIEWAEDIQDYLVGATDAVQRKTYLIDKNHKPIG